MTSLHVRALAADLPFGARVQNLTEAALEAEDVRRELRGLLRDRGVIVFEEIAPADHLQIAISRVFGPLKAYGDSYLEEMKASPEQSTVVEVDGERLAGWLPWHFDQCYNARPNRARVLRCRQAPPTGGLTGFLDGIALYAAMSPDLREQIETRHVRYTMDLRLAHMRFGRPDRFVLVHEPPKPEPDLRCASHPAVVTGAAGNKCLHVSPWMALGIVGADGELDPQADALLDAVSHEIGRLARTWAYHHSWRPTDLLVWDNLRMLHAASGCDPGSTRIMYRSTILDD